MVKIVEENIDPDTYRVNCIRRSCNRLLEYDSSDLRKLETISDGVIYGISCPTCGTCISEWNLKKIRRNVNHTSFTIFLNRFFKGS